MKEEIRKLINDFLDSLDGDVETVDFLVVFTHQGTRRNASFPLGTPEGVIGLLRTEMIRREEEWRISIQEEVNATLRARFRRWQEEKWGQAAVAGQVAVVVEEAETP